MSRGVEVHPGRVSLCLLAVTTVVSIPPMLPLLGGAVTGPVPSRRTPVVRTVGT